MGPKPLDGVRVLEVAQHTFVPSAGAVLADWGAEVVKIEHPATGDAQRGLVRLSRGTGQWAPVQDAWDLANDESLIANGRIAKIVDAEGNPRRLVNSPVKFDDVSNDMIRAPLFAEHTDEVIRELGVDDDRLIELKIAGAIT